MSKNWLVAVAVLILCVSAGLAQKKKEEPTRSVSGTVTSAEDVAVTGAVVQLKNMKNLQIRSFITKENGQYYFHGLNPDVDFELKADYSGASSRTKTLSSFDARKEAIINLKLNKK